MRDPFAGYDAWLERPYQDAIAEADAFYDWCEENGYECLTEQQLQLAEAAYHDYIEAEYEDAALAMYEAYMDRLEDERYEMEDW